jgi:PHD/YefM family antitoxin component YafN of YafNO toxin-antitoxin module
MADGSWDVLDLEPPFSAMVNECELTGRRSVFLRNGRPVAILISNDEYVALRETAELSASPDASAAIAMADEDIRKGAILLAEDLFVE